MRIGAIVDSDRYSVNRLSPVTRARTIYRYSYPGFTPWAKIRCTLLALWNSKTLFHHSFWSFEHYAPKPDFSSFDDAHRFPWILAKRGSNSFLIFGKDYKQDAAVIIHRAAQPHKIAFSQAVHKSCVFAPMALLVHGPACVPSRALLAGN